MGLSTHYNLKYQTPTSTGAGGAALDANFAEINSRGGPCNWSASTDPSATSDSAHNFLVGSKWFNTTTGVLWICVDATPTSAVWQQVITPKLVGPVYPALGSVNCFGDSLTTGSGASSPSTTSRIPLIEAAVGRTFNNQAVGSSQAADQTTVIWTTVVGKFDTSIYCLGNTDQAEYGSNVLKQSIFQAGHLSQIAFLAIPEVNKVLAYDTTKVTYSSGWAAPESTDRIRMYSSTVSSTATFQVYGPAILVSMIYLNSSTATYTITIDGVSQGTFNVAPPTSMTTYLGAGYGPRALLFEGFADGFHTVVITVTAATGGGNSVFFDWAAGLGSSFGPKVLVGNCIHATSAGYIAYGGSDANVDSYNATIASNVYKLRQYGLDVILNDFGSTININTDLYSDGRHPNDTGYSKLSVLELNSLDISSKAPKNSTPSPSYNDVRITGSAANDSILKVGSLEFQPYAVGNCWIGSNVYYDSGFYSRNDGPAGLFYFAGDSGQFRFFDTTTAGTALGSMYDVQVKFGQYGEFGVGEMVETPGDFTGSIFLVDRYGAVTVTNTLELGHFTSGTIPSEIEGALIYLTDTYSLQIGNNGSWSKVAIDNNFNFLTLLTLVGGLTLQGSCDFSSASFPNVGPPTNTITPTGWILTENGMIPVYN